MSSVAPVPRPPGVSPAQPDRTALLLIIFVLTTALLLGPQFPGVVSALGPLGAFLSNQVIEAFVVSLFLANIVFAYLWRAAPWAKALVALSAMVLILPYAGQQDPSLLDLSISIMIFAALALGLNIVVGLAGLLDLGYIAFFAVGAYLWGIVASPRFSRILGYYAENPDATNLNTLMFGIFLTVVTAAALWALARHHRTQATTRRSLWGSRLAGLGLVVGITLTVRSLLVLNEGQADALAGGTDPGFFWLFLALSVLAAALVGVIIGLPVLRLKGDYLAIITLALGEVIRVLANNLDLYSGGSQGITPIGSASVPWFDALALRLGFAEDQLYLLFLYVIVLLAIGFIMLANVRLDRSRTGRAWIAIRDDEVAAQAMGVPLMQTKLIAFAAGASFAGVMGMLFAAKQTFVSPESFILNESISVLAMVILGGMGSIPGVMLGAAVVTLLNFRILPGLGEFAAELAWIPQEANPGQYNRFIFGAILVTVMLNRPEGLLPSRRRALELHRGDDQDDDSQGGEGGDFGEPAEVYSPGYATRKENDREGGAK